MRVTVPTFHGRVSLLLGVIAGFFLSGFAIYNIILLRDNNIVGNIIIVLVGVVLSAHCFDIFRYYKRHRIVKIQKTETHRIVTKASGNPSRLMCMWNALKIAWEQAPFRAWLIICTLGIVAGVLVNIGMTNLVLLVAIACLGLGMEVANTSIEVLLDIVHPAYSEKVKVVKDLFATVPIFVYSAYVVSWLILVVPSMWQRLV